MTQDNNQVDLDIQPGWEDAIRDAFGGYLQDPAVYAGMAGSTLVVKANIHITLAMTRLQIM